MGNDKSFMKSEHHTVQKAAAGKPFSQYEDPKKGVRKAK